MGGLGGVWKVIDGLVGGGVMRVLKTDMARRRPSTFFSRKVEINHAV